MKRKSFLQRSASVIGASLLPSLTFATDNKKKPLRFDQDIRKWFFLKQ